MPSQPYIQLQHVSFFIESALDINQWSYSFSPLKYGIVGDNGSGKSTLLKLICGELSAHDGVILNNGTIAYCPQQYNPPAQTRIADTLQVSDKLNALSNISQGSTNPLDYECIASDWDITERIASIFSVLDISDLSLSQHFNHLSGGQKTKILLARVMLSRADFIVLDEPTNNLDQATRQQLIGWIAQQDCGFLIVSHDRELLNTMSCIVELSRLGLNSYGGNYNHYKERKDIEEASYEHAIHAQKEILKKSKQRAQTRRETHEQGEALGRRGKIAQIKARGSYDKIAFKTQQGRSEKTNKRIRIQAERKISGINETLNDAMGRVEHKHDIHADLSATTVPLKKSVLTIDSLCFAYKESEPLINTMNISIIGPERIALQGKNGAGKTTLIKLILNELQPKSGSLHVGVDKIGYLNQEVSFLNPEHTLIEAFEYHNPDINTRHAYFALASMNFRGRDGLKKVAHLSGGEKIRAGLSIQLLSSHPPQLIILDEPTNHLDLRSISAIESMIKAYKGAVIAISHDLHFLKNIHIERYIAIERLTMSRNQRCDTS
jgi:ATPase subunit of ABC transporter with duplicated ATPase domains